MAITGDGKPSAKSGAGVSAEESNLLIEFANSNAWPPHTQQQSHQRQFQSGHMSSEQHYGGAPSSSAPAGSASVAASGKKRPRDDANDGHQGHRGSRAGDTSGGSTPQHHSTSKEQAGSTSNAIVTTPGGTGSVAQRSCEECKVRLRFD